MKLKNKNNLRLHLLIVVTLCSLAKVAYPISHSAQTSDSDWDTVTDSAALGSQYITTRANTRGAPEGLGHDRVASYRVSFDRAGTYDLYIRARSRRRQASMVYNSNFGTDVNWQGVTGGGSLKGDEFVWVNLSQARGHSSFTVDNPDTLLFSIGSRRRGMDIDAFAFGATGTNFSDEELDAAALGKAAQSDLIGLQAQYAHTFGQDTLSDQGVELKKFLTEGMIRLRAELKERIPTIDESRVAAWRELTKAEEPYAEKAASTAKTVERLKAAEANLQRQKRIYSFGPATLENAQAALAQAQALPEDDADREDHISRHERLVGLRERDVNRAERDLRQARQRAKEAADELPEALRKAEETREAHERAMADTLRAMNDTGAREILFDDQLDSILAPYMVLRSATPRGLAKFGEQSHEHTQLIRQLLDDTELMVQMLVADGPHDGRYGEAMKIYTDVQQASPRAREDGIFQRLALAVSLGHAGGISERDQPGAADPVKRYQHFEQAYLAGELHCGFSDLCVWSLVMVVRGRDCDETMAWGRKMLRNLRPNLVPTNGDTSKYVDTVNGEIAYSRAGPGRDREDVRLMQNILANGGICGRRAFFGRFLLRAHGVPTTARSEPGHATLAHWHPDGWRVRLGGSWGPGNRGRYATMNRARSSPYGVDLNFLATTQARQDADAFIRVKRSQWIGTLMGERRKAGFHSRNELEPTLWYDLGLHEQRMIIARLDAAARGEPAAVASAPAPLPGATGTVTVDANGVITIPSAATSSPTESVTRIFRGHQPEILFFVEDQEGYTRLHLSRYSNEFDRFTYTVNAPRAGTYQMAAHIATPRWDQSLHASVNGRDAIDMPLPYTEGAWQRSTPVEIELAAGRNELTFHGGRVAIDHFTLTPVQ